MAERRFTVTEYDPGRPWIRVGESRHMSIELKEDESFAVWAAGAWPPPRFKAELEPDPLGPWQDPS